MNIDLTKILEEWDYEPGHINVRIIEGIDGDPKLQVRLDLGILQMALDGRPDGQRPNNHESLLDSFEAQFDQSEGEGKPELSEEDARLLREEAVQYYHRYMALLVVEDYERVIRDTTRNLRLLDFCAEHGSTEADRNVLEQFRPYIMMVRARAIASQAIHDDEPKAALHAIDEGIDALRQYFADLGEPDTFDQSNEVQMLRQMRESLVPKLPVSQTSELRKRIKEAIVQENYELAAILRDELRLIKD